MAVPLVEEQDWLQFNYVVNDTIEVIVKQNGFNQSLEAFQTAINEMVAAFNSDVDFVALAREELDADNIVHKPGSGLPNAAGAAYSRDVVGGSGALMAEGAFGLPLQAPSEEPDFNLLPNGFSISPLGGLINSPPGSGTDRHWVYTVKMAGMFFQLARQRVGDATGALWHRASSGDPANAVWRRIYDNESVVGTITRAGGQLTGAIFERGSNSFGSWAKTADGTMKIWAYVLFTYNQANYLQAIWTFPQPFASPEKISPMGVLLDSLNPNVLSGTNKGGLNDPLVYMVRNSSNTEATVRLARPVGGNNLQSGDAATAFLEATGFFYN